MKKVSVTSIQKRMRWVLFFFLSALGALDARLFLMTIVHHRDYVRLAVRQQGSSGEFVSERGSIFARDKDGNKIPLALDKTFQVLVASPNGVKDPAGEAGVIADYFHLDRNDIEAKLSKKNDPHEILERKVDPQEAAGFDVSRLPGIFFEDESRRVYPNGILASHVLGFVGVQSDVQAGRYGLERMYDTDLAGRNGSWRDVKDAGGFWVALGRRIINPPQSGASLVLTLDYNIQRKAQELLHALREKWGAPSGAVLVLDPKSGKILADAGDPAFDPNAFSREKDFGVFLNPTVEATYEFGSVIKPITMAAGIEEGLVTPDATYTDTGALHYGSYTIRNFDGNAYGVQTMTQVLEKSLNTGAVYVARLLGHDRQLAFLKKFGFGEKTGVDMLGEVAGNISNLNSGRDIDFATASFGQGISATPLQMARAIAAIANGGTLMRPYIVEKVIDDSGNQNVHGPQMERTVISSSTAETLTKMLVSAVRSGFETRAGLKGYFVAGKTGTAQIPKAGGRGYSDAVIHTFVGYAPAFHPRFLILLQLNEPRGNRFAANTLTPAFHDLAEFILNYYEVPPDEK
ncbi:MAG: penicillin-binding protein 2 [Candidatus Sungbacteria bacterium]|uniref:Penicillin-binding protein 2 n=1 Tax=Candidatus Sungiibacteriota bacterium TaxID=2750080 RepID=A0A932QYH0_9BACT|nr:penicillin-binding protein 2 [Candidatus Sungbacteria bacterium]